MIVVSYRLVFSDELIGTDIELITDYVSAHDFPTTIWLSTSGSVAGLLLSTNNDLLSILTAVSATHGESTGGSEATRIATVWVDPVCRNI